MCLRKTMKMLVMHRWSIWHHNKSYDYENNNKNVRKPKFSRKLQEEKVEAIWNHKIFSEKRICDPMNIFLTQ